MEEVYSEVVNCCVLTTNLKNLERISLSSIRLTDTVHKLKVEVGKNLDASVKEFAVLFHGKSLNEEDTLESNGIKYGMTIHLMPKPLSYNKPVDNPAVERSEVGLEHLALTLKASMRSPTFKNSFQMFTKQSIFENIIAAAPAIADDPVAIACLLDADLLSQFTDLATLKRAAESHPALVEAIGHIVANILDPSNQPGPSGLNNSSLPLAYSYLLEQSDDDSSSPADLASSSGTSQTPSMENAASGPFTAITPAQLASALAAVVTSSPIVPPTALPLSSNQATPSTPGTSSARQIISNELFNQAMQQAMGVSTQSQIQQLRDMGITDDGLSMRALQLTGGDVQAALELIFDMQQNDRQNL